jgi:hypothetical protein
MLLLGHEYGAPHAARAGCSHRVVSQSDRLRGFDQLDAFIVGDSSSMVSGDLVADRWQQRDQNRPLPCAGPSCADHVPAPEKAAPEGSGGSDQWGALDNVISHAIVAPAATTIDEQVVRAIAAQPSIFHPPPG